MPTLERLDLLEPIVAAGGDALPDPGLDRVGLDQAAARARPASAVNLRREVLDPMVREAAAATPGVDLHLGQTDDRPAARRRHGQRRHGPRPRRRRERPDEQARDRRRRPRLADRRAGRRQGEGHAPRALRLRRLLRRARCPTTRPTARSGSWTRTGRRPSRTDSDLVFYAAMPTKELLPEFKRDPTEALISFLAGLPDGAADPRGAPGRTGARQDRDAEPGALPDRPRPGPRRRRGAGRRPALRGRLRLGVPVGRMAGRLRRPGAARRGVAGARPEALPPPPQTQARRPRVHDPRLLDRPEAHASGTAAVRRRRPRPQGRDDLRQVRDPPGRACQDAWRRRSRGRSSSTRGTRSAGAGATRRARPSARRQPRPDERRRRALAAEGRRHRDAARRRPAPPTPRRRSSSSTATRAPPTTGRRWSRRPARPAPEPSPSTCPTSARPSPRPASSIRRRATRPSSARRWRRSGSSASTSCSTTSAGRSGSPGRWATPMRWPASS